MLKTAPIFKMLKTSPTFNNGPFIFDRQISKRGPASDFTHWLLIGNKDQKVQQKYYILKVAFNDGPSFEIEVAL